jgi:c(7)-type cytochrome triheme protein
MEKTLHRKDLGIARGRKATKLIAPLCALGVLSAIGFALNSDPAAQQMPAVDVVIKLNRMDPVAFSHLRHLAVKREKTAAGSAGFSCDDCHPVPFERVSGGPIGMEVPHETGGCAACHNGQKPNNGMPTAFPANTRCLTCHKSPD